MTAMTSRDVMRVLTVGGLQTGEVGVLRAAARRVDDARRRQTLTRRS